jgi:hypothetical protein
MLRIANGVAGIPELGSNAAVAGVFQHADFLAAFNFPADLGGKLELIAPVIDGPRAIGLIKIPSSVL